MLQPILQAMREQLQSCLDDVAARALGGMLQSTPDDLDAIACKTPPLWSDVVAAYRYQRVLCESGLFRHLGAGVRADGPRNLYHGPGFHALCRKLRGRAAPPPGLSPQTTPPTPPGLRKALANVSNCVELFGPPSTPRRLDGAAMLRHRHNLTHAGAGPAPHRRPPLGNTRYDREEPGHDRVWRDGLWQKQ